MAVGRILKQQKQEIRSQLSEAKERRKQIKARLDIEDERIADLQAQLDDVIADQQQLPLDVQAEAGQ